MINRTEYQHQYYLKRKERKNNTRYSIVKQCMTAVRKLRQEIGNYSCDKVLEVLAQEAEKEDK